MKYQVRIGEQSFAVEIDDLQRRPIQVRVDGEMLLVEPGAGPTAAAAPPAATVPAATPAPAAPAPAKAAPPKATSMVSPLPGTVSEVFAKAGDEVEAGAALFVIEAMKMKNSIRSIRAGRVRAVLVAPGQTVAHKQALLEFDP